MNRWMSLSLLVALSAVACKKEPPPEPEKAAAPAPKPDKPKKKAEKPKIKLPQFAPGEPKTEVSGAATAADFEEEAEKTLHVENLEAELDRLEAEITGG